MLEYAKDKDQKAWHQCHANRRDRKKQFQEELRGLGDAERKGIPCDMLVRLTSVASKYDGTYSALNPLNTRKGVYDYDYSAVRMLSLLSRRPKLNFTQVDEMLVDEKERGDSK